MSLPVKRGDGVSSGALSDNLELGEFQQELFGACVLKLHRRLGVLTTPLDPRDSTNAKTTNVNIVNKSRAFTFAFNISLIKF